MSAKRSFVCAKCNALVELPRYSRMTLEQLRTIHASECPAEPREAKPHG